MDWFLYDMDLRYKKVNRNCRIIQSDPPLLNQLLESNRNKIYSLGSHKG